MDIKMLKRRRLLRYWGTIVKQYSLIFLGVLGTLVVFQFIFGKNTNITNTLLEIPMDIMYIGMFMSFICVVVDIRNGTAVSLLFGGTRKEAFAGIQLSTLLRVILLVIFYSIIESVLIFVVKDGYTFHIMNLIFDLGIILIVSGVAQIIAAITIRIGGKALIFLMACCGAVGGGFGGYFFSSMPRGVKRLLFAGWEIPVIYIAIGIVVYLIGAIINYKNINKYVVVA